MTTFEYCNRYGFKPENITARLRLLEFCDADRELSLLLHDKVIVPHLNKIVNIFYDDFMLKFPEFSPYLISKLRIESLKRTQHDYLMTLGVDYDTPAYFEVRLRVGEAHARIGLPLPLYGCAYHKLEQVIRQFVQREAVGNNHYGDIHRFISRIISLDMSLANECYHRKEVHDLEHSVEVLRNMESTLRQKAAVDALTRLYNRGEIEASINQSLGLVKQDKNHMCLIMADLDKFKNINDTHGHVVGDRVLQDIARRLQAAVRGFDIVGRYGGEEFIVILNNTSYKTAEQVAERIRTRVNGSPVNIDGLAINITISQGVTDAKPFDTIESLVGRADDALYQAKNKGRDCVVMSA
ncbi:MAG: diguanylate cyclase [Gammaproteobacteria bacterium]|nr:diguanylate cyclase [Gammaproteobacteria bacterium]MDH5593078.1 diguanylate cyclase [Gammaproteobacteria bacterium]